MPEAARKVSIQLRVNGKLHACEVEPRQLLVEFIREDLELTGTHIGCDTTYCGACTVLMNGAAVKSCTVFAVQADGARLRPWKGWSEMANFIRFKRHLAIATVSNAATARLA